MGLKKSTTRQLRLSNRTTLLKKIYFNNPISRLELSSMTELSPATATNVTGEFLEEGLVIESGSIESEGGRPRTLLKVNPSHAYLIGIDVGETCIKSDLFDLSLQHLATVDRQLGKTENQPDQVVDQIVESVEELLSHSKKKSAEVLGVGIGFPGLVDPEAGISIFAPNWGWHDIPLSNILEARLKLPIAIDNGAKAMALAESMFGGGQGVDSLAVLLVGTGIGAGIIEGDSLYRGAMNSAGELGHTTLEINGRTCRCGRKGCLEAYAGAAGIISRYLEQSGKTLSDISGDQKEMVSQIIKDAEKGDQIARRVIEDTVEYLLVGIGNLINMVNPQKILLGGWVGMMLADKILPVLSTRISDYALQQPSSKTEFGLCQLKDETVAQGAATLILEKFFEAGGRPLTIQHME